MKSKAKSDSKKRPLTALDISEARRKITEASIEVLPPESETNIRHKIPAATNGGQKQAVNWWYVRAKPEKRGVFFGMILTSGKPVEVHDKEEFTKKIMRWLAEDVHQIEGARK